MRSLIFVKENKDYKKLKTLKSHTTILTKSKLQSNNSIENGQIKENKLKITKK